MLTDLTIALVYTNLKVTEAIQGTGGGGIINMTEIIVSDLVPLAERGLCQGILGLVWSLAAGIGPPIVGRTLLSRIQFAY